jgi:hypothetical protein
LRLPERMDMDLLDALKKIIIALNEHRIEYALCGGLAMAVYALPIRLKFSANKSVRRTSQAIGR